MPASKRPLLLAAALVFVTSCQRLGVERACPLTPSPERAYTAFVQSSPGCGYCRLALRDLSTLSDEIATRGYVFVDEGDELQRLASAYPKVDFTDGSACEGYSPEFFPTVVVLDRGGEVVYRSKGWTATRFKSLQRTIDVDGM